MSATVSQFPVRQLRAFEDRAYPAGMPANLDTSPIYIDAAADGLCALAGECWDHITPERREEFRGLAIFATACAFPEGQKLAAYSMVRVVHPAVTDAAALVRKGLADNIRAAFLAAVDRMAGRCNPKTHTDLVTLMEQDSKVGIW